MSHCNRHPVPTDPAHHCDVCQVTPGETASAGMHYTRDCPLLPQEMRNLASKQYHKILVNRNTVPRDQNLQNVPISPHVTLKHDVEVVEAYYQLQQLNPTPEPKSDYPTPHNPDHFCTKCKPGSGRENFALKRYHLDEVQPPHFEMDCFQTNGYDFVEIFALFDKALKHMYQCPTDCSEVSRELVAMVRAYYGLEPLGDDPTTGIPPLQADVSPCATKLSQDMGEEQHGLKSMDCLSPSTIESNSNSKSFCPDHLELVYAYMRWNKNTQIPSPLEPIPSHTTPRGFDRSEQASLSKAGENVDPKASPTKDTRHTVATDSPPSGEVVTDTPPSNTKASPTEHSRHTVATDSPIPGKVDEKVDPKASPIEDTRHTVAMATTGDEKHRTSPNDMEHHLLDELSTKIEGFHQSTDCLSLADRQHSSLVTDKALNITGATGLSERGPDSNEKQVEHFCNHQNGVPNLGEPHRYSIALSDPYIRVVPPPPITVKPPD